MLSATLSFVVALGLLAPVFAAPEANRIVSLPGYTGKIPFNQYSGYVNIDQDSNKNLFYWFTESQKNPSTDPLVVWLNGGPGSSSLVGLLLENGPFKVASDGKTLSANPNSWNQVANMLYIESPVGVGFSYSDDTSDYTIGDSQTAIDNYKFLMGWMQLYPEYANHSLYIAGESYAGHYIPELADYIVTHDTEHKLNMAGLLLGNVLTESDAYSSLPIDPKADAWNFMTMIASRALIPQTAYAKAIRACNWEQYLFPEECSATNWTSPSEACIDALTQCMEYFPDDVDIYGLAYPICQQQSQEDSWLRYTSQWHGPSALLAKKASAKKRQNIPSTVTGSFDPCSMSYLGPYLNQPAVQTALHAKPTDWEWVSTVLNYAPDDFHINIVPIYQRLLRATQGWRIMIFSGDGDGCIPHFGTQKWVECLGRPVVNGWHTWHLNGQVAGNTIDYDKISFTTIKDAGHAVPFYQPEKGYAFFSRWITNTAL